MNRVYELSCQTKCEFADLIRAEIELTVGSSQEDIDDEIRALMLLVK